MKKISAVLAALIILLTSCSFFDDGHDNSAITITVWTYYNGAQLTAFNALVEQFNETVGHDEGITVESYSQGSINDLERNVLDSVQNKVGADKVPNIFAAYADTAFAVDKLGMVADISPYFEKDELDKYVDGYIEEGRFGSDGSLKIFPCAKSTEVFLLNNTDWTAFARATGAKYNDFSTIEGLSKTAQKYYEWTDSLTPDVPNDGKAFFGRDAMANYIIIGSMQLGHEVFSVKDGVMNLDFDRDTLKKLWDNYYVPFIKGYFASSGRFRSDDVKTGNILAFVGSSSGSTFFPDKVVLGDNEEKRIEMKSFQSPQFNKSAGYVVQQGAGMVVAKASEEEIEASVKFLKWFTDSEQNISFSVGSGYMPVRKDANSITVIKNAIPNISETMQDTLATALSAVKSYRLYTTKAFMNGSDARKVLEYSMSDIAKQDRAVVVERLEAGMELDKACEDFVTDEYFDTWFNSTLNELKKYEG